MSTQSSSKNVQKSDLYNTETVILECPICSLLSAFCFCFGFSNAIKTKDPGDFMVLSRDLQYSDHWVHLLIHYEGPRPWCPQLCVLAQPPQGEFLRGAHCKPFPAFCQEPADFRVPTPPATSQLLPHWNFTASRFFKPFFLSINCPPSSNHFPPFPSTP